MVEKSFCAGYDGGLDEPFSDESTILVKLAERLRESWCNACTVSGTALKGTTRS